ncbi:MAG: hypothetical protein R3C59_03500 [Planctomycetaceae bacterium]
MKPIVSPQNQRFLRVNLATLRQIRDRLLPNWEFIELPEFAFLHVQDDVFWFALGGEHTWQMLERELTLKREDGADDETVRSTYLLKCHLNLELATGDHGRESGLADYLNRFEKAYGYWSADRYVEIVGKLQEISIPARKSLTFETIGQKALTDRPAQAELALFNDRHGLQARLTVDRSLALLFYGRIALNWLDQQRVWSEAVKRATKPLALPALPQGLLQAESGEN